MATHFATRPCGDRAGGDIVWASRVIDCVACRTSLAAARRAFLPALRSTRRLIEAVRRGEKYGPPEKPW